MEKIILVSGMSGAGKSTTMSILEDMGYHCIDQFPKQLLKEFVDMRKDSADLRYRYVALSTPLFDLPEMYEILVEEKVNFQMLFLDASSEQLLLRYKFTKHNHPMLLAEMARTLDEAVSLEKQMFRDMGQMKGIMIDTTNFDYIELKQRLESFFTVDAKAGFTVSFVSFGYKFGLPHDSDLLFDVRFLPNPYWHEDMRLLSGDDKRVYDYVMDKDSTKKYVEKLTTFLNYSFEQYDLEGRNHLTVGIGCTGGQHRSVSLVNYLYDLYEERYQCYKKHRDKKDPA